MELSKQLDASGVIYDTLLYGEIALAGGRPDLARTFFMEALKGAQRRGSRPYAISSVLRRFAWLAAVTNQPVRAIQLAGATASLRGIPFPPSQQVKDERRLQPARDQLSQETQQEAYEKGRRMTMDQAVEYALSGERV
jgi:hypothetical protein